MRGRQDIVQPIGNRNAVSGRFKISNPFRFSVLLSCPRPFNQVIEILSVSLDQDKDNDESPEFDQLAGNPLHKNIQRQLQVCSDVVERITVEHHGSLNSSVQAMGGVARHYNQTRANVGTLREQLRECKQLLQTGSTQTDVRELWQRKLQFSLVLRLLGALEMIKVGKGSKSYYPRNVSYSLSLPLCVLLFRQKRPCLLPAQQEGLPGGFECSAS